MTNLREAAAIIALLRSGTRRWQQWADAIEDAGSALALYRGDEDVQTDPRTPRLFPDAVTRPPDTLEAIEDEIRAWEREGIHLTTVLDEDYPLNLRTVHNRPPLLFIRGTVERRDERAVAIVGTRQASEHGLHTTRKVAHELSCLGFTIISGLAVGIDTAAHASALDAGGRTLAVVGTGLRRSYPAKNRGLQELLGSRYAVLSQFWPDQPPTKTTFPMRNVVMSGLARATVVVEASETSGAKMQARFALEHGRPVFLVRSLLRHTWAQDCSRRPGAYVVDSSQEIAETLDRLTHMDHLALT